MDEKRIVVIGVTVVIVVATITILAVTLSSPTTESRPSTEPPQLTDFHPLLIISLDGFRADYIGRFTRTLIELAKTGVYAPYMIPSYPTITFPNHYTIVTGLYPESHGIVANYFYDPTFDANFNMSACDGRFWGGEPMWVTLNNQDKRSATYFWPGSDCNVSGITPDEWFPYDENVTFEDRIDQVLEWLSRPIETRPHWVSLYFDQPDSDGHNYGPDSVEVYWQVQRMDNLINKLITGLRDRDLLDIVNIIIVSDHGMAPTGPGRVILLNDFVHDINASAEVSTGAFSSIRLKNNSEEWVNDMLENLTCASTSLRAYTKKDLPRRFHYYNNDRIDDIVLDLKEGYITNVAGDPWNNLGDHGYDYYVPAMRALFIASGPDFLSGVVLDPFPNTELYHLMCHLTQVDPAPHNGTIGSLNAALVDPVPIPELPQEENPPRAEFPNNPQSRFNISGCPGNISENDPWLNDLHFTTDEMTELESLHFPWGMPLVDGRYNNTDLVLLHHQDHVTAYSRTLKTPLWTSLTLDSRQSGSGQTQWRSDVRLTAETTPTCQSYSDLEPKPENYTMFPLFPPVMSSNSTPEQISFLVSNAVPVTEEMSSRWNVLMDLLRWMASASRPLNLVLGPVFSEEVFSETQDKYPILPSDLFAVATWCRVKDTKLPDCDPLDLRAIGFIYPETQVIWNCLGNVAFALENSGRVRDVEGITGLSLYSTLRSTNRTHVLLQATMPFSRTLD